MDTKEVQELVELQVTVSGSTRESTSQPQDSKIHFGESSEALVEIGEDLPYSMQNVLSNNGLSRIGAEPEMALLVRTGLHRFASWTSNLLTTDPKLVQTFLENYSLPKRKAEVMKLAYIFLNIENVHKFLWLPSAGPNVGNLSNLGLNVADCFLSGTVFEELDENQNRVEVKKVPKVAFLPT